jgi:hypothetical protein
MMYEESVWFNLDFWFVRYINTYKEWCLCSIRKKWEKIFAYRNLFINIILKGRVKYKVKLPLEKYYKINYIYELHISAGWYIDTISSTLFVPDLYILYNAFYFWYVSRGYYFWLTATGCVSVIIAVPACHYYFQDWNIFIQYDL